MATNSLSDFLGGYEAGNAMLDQQRQQRQQSQLARLAPQVVSGDPQAFAQAAAIDPQAAQSYQSSGDQIMKRARGAAKYLEGALKTGDQRQIMAARQQIAPFMNTLRPGTSYPMNMDPAEEAQRIQGFLAQTAYLDSAGSGGLGVQSTYVDDQGNRVAIMRDGTTQILGANAANNQIIDTGAGGFYGVNKGTLVATPVNPGGGQQQPTRFRSSSGEIIDASAIRDPALRAQIMANPDQWGLVPDGGSITGQIDQSGRLVKQEALTPYQQATLAGQARDDARADASLSIQAQNAADARAARQDAAEVKRQAAEQKAQQAQQAISVRQAQLADVQRGVQRVRGALAGLRQSSLGTGPVAQYGQRYTQAGQELEAAVGAMNNSMLALTRVPGMGAQSDLEARIAGLRFPQLGMNESVNEQTMRDLEAFIGDLGRTARQSDEQDRAAIRGSSGTAPAQSGGGVDDLLSKYGIR